jgi:hypothetical protein
VRKTRQTLPCPVQEPKQALKPAAAVPSPASGANAFAPPLSARIRASLTAAEVRIPAVLVSLIQRQADFSGCQRKTRALAEELAASVQCAESLARERDWSQRRLAARLGFCPRTWRRIKNLNVNPEDWLQRLRAALSRLRPQTI